jgi:hypothetical protein
MEMVDSPLDVDALVQRFQLLMGWDQCPHLGTLAMRVLGTHRLTLLPSSVGTGVGVDEAQHHLVRGFQPLATVIESDGLGQGPAQRRHAGILYGILSILPRAYSPSRLEPRLTLRGIEGL